MTGFKQLVRLVKRFTSSPSNPYEPKDIAITFGEARIVYAAKPADLAPSGYIDRGVYARLMLDAATLAAGSVAEEVDVSNDSFSMYGHKNKTQGTFTAVARLTHTDEGRYTVETRLLDEDLMAIGSGYGTFSTLKALPDQPESAEEPEVDEEDAPHIAYGTIWQSPVGFIHLN